MQYTLNLYSASCQMYLNKNSGKIRCNRYVLKFLEAIPSTFCLVVLGADANLHCSGSYHCDLDCIFCLHRALVSTRRKIRGLLGHEHRPECVNWLLGLQKYSRAFQNPVDIFLHRFSGFWQSSYLAQLVVMQQVPL